MSGGPDLEVEGAKRSRSNTRPRMLDGAYRVFVDKGFTAATVEDICQAAGFTRGAFYSNFSTKDELFLALWDRQAERIVDGLRLLARELDAQPDRLDEILEAMFQADAYDRDWFVLNTEFLLYALRNAPVAKALARHRAVLRRQLAEIVTTVCEIRRRPVPADLDTFCRLVIATFEAGQNQLLVEPRNKTNERLRRMLLDAVLAPLG